MAEPGCPTCLAADTAAATNEHLNSPAEFPWELHVESALYTETSPSREVPPALHSNAVKEPNERSRIHAENPTDPALPGEGKAGQPATEPRTPTSVNWGGKEQKPALPR